MIPEGLYMARGLSMVDSKSKDKGSLAIVVMFSITQEGPHKGQMVEWKGWLSDKAKARTAESLVLCGFDGTDFETIKTNEVSITVQHEELPVDPNNPTAPPRKYARASWVNDPNRGGVGMVPLDAGERVQVLADLRGLVFAKREEMNKKAAQGDAGSFNYGANGGAPHGAPPPAQQQPPPAPPRAAPRF